MITDLLDYTRARMDRALPIARREVDVLEVCKQATDELRLLNPGRVIRLDCEGSMTRSLDPDRAAASLRGISARTGRGRGGTRLGLYIVKQIVDAHGGSITVRSSQAEGTTFSVLWPAR